MSKEKTPQPLDLNELSSCVVNREYSRAEGIIGAFIDMQLRAKLNFVSQSDVNNLTASQMEIMSYQSIERLTCLLSQLLCDKSYEASDGFFSIFVANKRFINNLFTASSYRNTEHIVIALGLNGKNNYSRSDVRKLFMLVTPETSFDLPWLQLAKFLPMETLRTYIGLMYCAEFNFSKRSSEQLNELALLADKLPTLTFDKPGTISFLSSTYFNVSTLTGVGKYVFKKWVVKHIENFMDTYLTADNKRAIAEISNPKIRKEKPVLAIFHERYSENHAMYRCYHSLIISLQEKFHVVGIGQKGIIDDIGKADHHEFIEFEDERRINETINEVLALKVDILMYTSLGMNNLSLFMATQRLAPIQCVLPGHPSSTYFNNIDYMILEDLGISENNLENILTEKPIIMASKQIKVVPINYKLEELSPTDVTHIAINGVIPKVTEVLIDICQKITIQGQNKVHFHFFMNSPTHDIEYFSALSVMRRILPNATIHPFGDYNSYMNNLAVCDFALPTLPFGGANSNIDLVRLGIPKLYILDESDLPGATDYYMWKEFNELSGLCSNVEEMIERAVEFVNQPEKLLEAKAKVSKIDIERFFSTGTEKSDDRLLRSLNNLIE
ncbi:hypothetical protein [Thalassotalea sp. SU-HH00458]|uniref:hypothetical protein n=1 Tax=Thalassotalea sp. SU-HH00458 TaxID=3127657 RepID=UPI003108A295